MSCAARFFIFDFVPRCVAQAEQRIPTIAMPEGASKPDDRVHH